MRRALEALRRHDYEEAQRWRDRYRACNLGFPRPTLAYRNEMEKLAAQLRQAMEEGRQRQRIRADRIEQLEITLHTALQSMRIPGARKLRQHAIERAQAVLEGGREDKDDD